jgi:hypothetical protein
MPSLISPNWALTLKKLCSQESAHFVEKHTDYQASPPGSVAIGLLSMDLHFNQHFRRLWHSRKTSVQRHMHLHEHGMQKKQTKFSK